MTLAWYQRMNRRERLLSWIVAGTLLVLLNLWILSSLLGAIGGAQRELATLRGKLAEQALYAKERDTWVVTLTKRKLRIEIANVGQLLDLIKYIAAKGF